MSFYKISAPIVFGAFLFTGILSGQEFPGKIKDPVLTDIYDQDMLSPEFHRGRRDALRALMDDSSVAVIFSSGVQPRSNDVSYEFHQDPDFYYLTGLREPDAVLVVFKNEIHLDGFSGKEILFVKDKDSRKERWTGRAMGPDDAMQNLGVELALPYDTLPFLKISWSQFKRVHCLSKPTRSEELNKRIKPETFSNMDPHSLKEWMARLREIKLEAELQLMRKAVLITCEALTEAMKALEPGDKEYSAEAVIQYVFTARGAEHEGYPSILGGGGNSCVLHYETNRKKLVHGDLLVCDVGAEYHGYTADVTRTMPVSGKFTKEQALIYNVVYEAQDSGIAHCKAGEDFRAPHKAALAVIQKRLLELGVIKTPSEVLKYFFHGTSHYLGLDVHDPGTFGKLKPRSVITVEPGIYIPEGSDCDKKWWGIGVRIEDDVLITESVPEVMSSCVPKTIAEIEEIMRKESLFNLMKR